MREPVVLAWSGGKDSAAALQRLRADPTIEVVALLTTFTAGTDRVAVHAVRRELLEAQAASAGLPLVPVILPAAPSNEQYRQAVGAVLEGLRARYAGLRQVAFGDLFLTDLREWREAQLAALSMSAIFPLWGLPTDRLAHELLEAGFRAVLTAVDLKRLPAAYGGRSYDAALLADLPAGVDPCGENGEFHTFVSDGPGFVFPVQCERGATVVREGYAYTDLAPAHAALEDG